MEVLLRERRREHFAEVVYSRFAGGIGERRGEVPTEARYAGGDEDLGILRHILLLIPRVQEREERHRAMEDTRHIRAQRLVEFVQTRSTDIVSELLYAGSAAVGFGDYGVVVVPADAGVGEEEVDVALFLLDLLDDFLQRVFIGYVADEGFDGPIDARSGGVLEGLFSSADDVNCFGAVGVESTGGVEAWPC